MESLLRGALGMIEEAAAAGDPEDVDEAARHPELQQVSSGYGWGPAD